MLALKHKDNLLIKEVIYASVFLIFLWSVCIASSLAWNIYNTQQQAKNHAKAVVLSSFNRDQAFRQWIAGHGGVYIQDDDTFILLDPATFLKKVMTRYPENFDSSIRMVGMKPFNQINTPTSVEKKMLEGFVQGNMEYLDSDITEENAQLGYFRPMRAKPACLSCHKVFGFKEGDLMGAAGVYIDLKPFLKSANKLIIILAITHLIIWLLGSIAIVFYGRKTKIRFKEHLRLEKQLKQSHDELEIRVEERTLELSKLSQALQHSPVLVLITNEKGLIEYVNPYFSEITGYTADEVLGKNPSILKSSTTPESVYKDLWKSINQDIVWSGELCNLRKDGSEFWVSASIAAFFSETDKIISYIAVEQDISDKKQTEYNLIQEKEQAEHASNTKSEFLASMSHELRTPLNAIIGFSQLAELDQDLNDQQKRNSTEIYNAGKHLLSLINDILDLSAIESGRVKLNIQQIKYATIINECYTLIYPLAMEKKITLDVSNYICGCEVTADYLRLKQVIINLLSNAVKYTAVSGNIKLKCDSSMKNNIIISISDNGKGISDENLINLFEPFNRLGMENSSIQGTGIGLVISKKLIKMMDGEIKVKSVLGQGSTFSIILPKSNEPQHSIAKKPPLTLSLDKQQSQRINIFYIEDNPVNLRLMKDIIDHYKHWKLFYSETAEEGIERIKKDKPDILLIDINLPGMNGIEACQVIKANEQLKHIPIIAVSAVATKANIKNAIDVGFIDYITKPIDVAKLIQTINLASHSLETDNH